MHLGVGDADTALGACLDVEDSAIALGDAWEEYLVAGLGQVFVRVPCLTVTFR